MIENDLYSHARYLQGAECRSHLRVSHTACPATQKCIGQAQKRPTISDVESAFLRWTCSGSTVFSSILMGLGVSLSLGPEIIPISFDNPHMLRGLIIPFESLFLHTSS